MKILYVTTVSLTMGFFPEHIRMLQEDGHVVELACNLDETLPEKVLQLGCAAHHIPFSRSPLHADNFKAYGQMKKLLETGQYDIVHTHTPNASAIVRLTGRKLRKKGMRVFYTAHGLHFYKGAPLQNWLLYYPVEWLLSWPTDVLITINREDYARAKKHLHAERIEYMPGVGIDLIRFDTSMTEEERLEKRAEIGVPTQAKLLLSVGELNRNKNHQVIIRTLAKLQDPNIHYCIAGKGVLLGELKQLAIELGVDDRVHFLGHRNDITQLYRAADICCFPSVREGLGMAVIEGIACGLPVVASDNRGTRDIIVHNEDGLLCPPEDVDAFTEAIQTMLDQPERAAAMVDHAKKCLEQFSLQNTLAALKEIYQL